MSLRTPFSEIAPVDLAPLVRESNQAIGAMAFTIMNSYADRSGGLVVGRGHLGTAHIDSQLPYHRIERIDTRYPATDFGPEGLPGFPEEISGAVTIRRAELEAPDEFADEPYELVADTFAGVMVDLRTDTNVHRRDVRIGIESPAGGVLLPDRPAVGFESLVEVARSEASFNGLRRTRIIDTYRGGLVVADAIAAAAGIDDGREEMVDLYERWSSVPTVLGKPEAHNVPRQAYVVAWARQRIPSLTY